MHAHNCTVATLIHDSSLSKVLLEIKSHPENFHFDAHDMVPALPFPVSPHTGPECKIAVLVVRQGGSALVGIQLILFDKVMPEVLMDKICSGMNDMVPVFFCGSDHWHCLPAQIVFSFCLILLRDLHHFNRDRLVRSRKREVRSII